MLYPAEGRKRCLKLGHFRTVDELAMGEHPPDRIIDGFAEPAALRTDVDKWHGFCEHMLVHDAF
jgi:hypothetical protein